MTVCGEWGWISWLRYPWRFTVCSSRHFSNVVDNTWTWHHGKLALTSWTFYKEKRVFVGVWLAVHWADYMLLFDLRTCIFVWLGWPLDEDMMDQRLPVKGGSKSMNCIHRLGTFTINGNRSRSSRDVRHGKPCSCKIVNLSRPPEQGHSPWRW